MNHEVIPQGEELREKDKGYLSGSISDGEGGIYGEYQGGGYYHQECWMVKQEYERRKFQLRLAWIGLIFGLVGIIGAFVYVPIDMLKEKWYALIPAVIITGISAYCLYKLYSSKSGRR